ncbi:carboxypeptidase-like regulatory domain-containing protein [Edaphobacter bradus]|uniref:carboxypeptidase-like regulatory domain-containing protein n=1 Tax=Edaphobacter bradus TaxID=2259016 RepID=UPI0021DF8D4E|nr:carboxypeptidase-like regulatory domain-containing protein [Edaphobacter bradus]
MNLAKHIEARLRFAVAIFIMATAETCLRAQVVELSGGTSTLYQSQGGTVTVHGKGYSAAAGAGMINGQFYSGAQFVKSTERASFILGTDTIPFDLPTDVFEGGHYLTAVGLGMRTKVDSAGVYTFVGETSTNFNSPFFAGTKAETPAAILFATGKVAPQWTASTRIIISPLVTIIHSFAYDSEDGVKFAISGGVGSGQLYLASSLAITHPLYDLKAAYIESGGKFRRANVAVPLTAEPDRDNVLLTIRPAKWMSLSAGRQNYLTPVYQSPNNVRSSVNQASGNLEVAGFGLSAMIFQSTYNNTGNVATAYSAGRAIGSRVHAQATYLTSKSDNSQKTDSLITNLQETLTPRWSISQMVNTSDGHNTFGFGGSFLSNFATLSADYQTYYVPARIDAPFEEALIVNAQIHLFGRLTLNGGTFVGPDGRLLYTTEAEGTVSREVGATSGALEHHVIGGMVIRGRVLDSSGQPVMGAALLIDQLPVYTDSRGYFYVRERKPHEHPLTVLVDQFLGGGLYRVVSAPSEVKSNTSDQAETVILVERITSARR